MLVHKDSMMYQGIEVHGEFVILILATFVKDVCCGQSCYAHSLPKRNIRTIQVFRRWMNFK